MNDIKATRVHCNKGGKNNPPIIVTETVLAPDNRSRGGKGKGK